MLDLFARKVESSRAFDEQRLLGPKLIALRRTNTKRK